ncbi:MAG: hypothetical protein HY908_29530 [Myxococcales bacterium]|nr:hypothetical protein [Myxococcales bacterium]
MRSTDLLGFELRVLVTSATLALQLGCARGYQAGDPARPTKDHVRDRERAALLTTELATKHASCAFVDGDVVAPHGEADAYSSIDLKCDAAFVKSLKTMNYDPLATAVLRVEAEGAAVQEFHDDCVERTAKHGTVIGCAFKVGEFRQIDRDGGFLPLARASLSLYRGMPKKETPRQPRGTPDVVLDLTQTSWMKSARSRARTQYEAVATEKNAMEEGRALDRELKNVVQRVDLLRAGVLVGSALGMEWSGSNQTCFDVFNQIVLCGSAAATATWTKDSVRIRGVVRVENDTDLPLIVDVGAVRGVRVTCQHAVSIAPKASIVVDCDYSQEAVREMDTYGSPRGWVDVHSSSEVPLFWVRNFSKYLAYRRTPEGLEERPGGGFVMLILE